MHLGRVSLESRSPADIFVSVLQVESGEECRRGAENILHPIIFSYCKGEYEPIFGYKYRSLAE